MEGWESLKSCQEYSGFKHQWNEAGQFAVTQPSLWFTAQCSLSWNVHRAVIKSGRRGDPVFALPEAPLPEAASAATSEGRLVLCNAVGRLINERWGSARSSAQCKDTSARNKGHVN